MALRSSLILRLYRKTQCNRDFIGEKHSETLVAPEHQKLVLVAALKGQNHAVTM